MSLLQYGFKRQRISKVLLLCKKKYLFCTAGNISLSYNIKKILVKLIV